MTSRAHSWQLAWPLILSNISVPMLGMVDTAVVGHLPDPAPLAAVALGSVAMSTLLFIFGFLRMGTTALSAQALGAGRSEDIAATGLRAVITALGLALLLLLAKPFLIDAAGRLLAPSPTVENGFEIYMAIRFWGVPAALLQIAIIGWFIGLQDTRVPLAILLVTNMVNAVLDLVFVHGFDMTADGVALATVIAEYTGLVMSVMLVIWKARRLGLTMPDRVELFALAPFKRLVSINGDIFIRSLVLEAAFLMFAGLGSRLGDLTLAANAVLFNFFVITAYGLDGFAFAAEALVGKAVGERNEQLLRRSIQASFENALVLALGLTALFAVFGSTVTGLLTSQEHVLAAANTHLGYVIALPLVSVWAFVWDGVFFGATRTAELRNAMLASLGIFIASAALLVPGLANHGLWATMLVFLASRGLLLAWLYGRIGSASGLLMRRRA